MRQQYDANPWGWDAAAKWSELAHDDARFVLVRGGGGAIQAFAHFRFDVNDEDYASRAVVYVWELQVAKPFQGAGLGRRVMGLLQLVDSFGNEEVTWHVSEVHRMQVTGWGPTIRARCKRRYFLD